MKVAINGFGRIGRLVFRIMEEKFPELEVVAINDLTDSEQLAYLLKYDTNHRNYKVSQISFDEENIIIDGRKIRISTEKYEAPEILFQPHLIQNEMPGVHEMLYNSINVSKIFL